MTIYTLMNTLEAIASDEPIDFYRGEYLLASLTLGEHNDRYRSFMAEYGLWSPKSMNIDTESLSYLVRL